MAIVALSDIMMRGLHPGCIMFLHDVAIRTGFGGIRKVRAALGVIKGISPHSDGAAKKKAGDNHFRQYIAVKN